MIMLTQSAKIFAPFSNLIFVMSGAVVLLIRMFSFIAITAGGLVGLQQLTVLFGIAADPFTGVACCILFCHQLSIPS